MFEKHRENIEAIDHIWDAVENLEGYVSRLLDEEVGGLRLHREREAALAALPPITAEQAQKIRALIRETEQDEGRFLAVLKASSVEEIKEFDRAVGLLKRSRAAKKTRRREPAGLVQISALADSQIFRGHSAPVFLLFEAHFGTLVEVAQAGPLHSRDVHKHVLAAVVGLNKSKSLSRIEPLHGTCRHVSLSLKKQSL